MKRTSNGIAMSVIAVVLVASGAASCGSSAPRPATDAAADSIKDSANRDAMMDASSDASSTDVLPRTDTAPADVAADVRPDAAPDIAPDLAPDLPADAPPDVPADMTPVDGSSPDAGVDALPPQPTGLVNPRTVPVTASTPLAVLAGAMLPANNATGVPVDTLLRLGFDGPPTLGTTGTITIHQAATDVSPDTIVDTIRLEDPYAIYVGGSLTMNQTSSKVNVIGNLPGTGVTQVRVVNYTPIFISENTVTIVPHNNKLAYNTTYYVTIDNGLFTGTLSAAAFTGISDPSAWTFTTKAAAPATLNVAADNTADFATVQGAVDSFPPGGNTVRTINIAPGVYQELLFLRNKNNVTFKGTSNGLDVVIQYDNCDGFNPGVGQGVTVVGGPTAILPAGNLSAGGRAVLLISTVTGVVFDGITIKNLHAQGSRVVPTIPTSFTFPATAAPTTPTSTGYTSAVTQAEAIYFNVNTTATLVAKHSNFISYQDTLQLKGFSWFYDSFITGDSDFIWGNANTALFERCEIKSRLSNNGASIVQSRAILGTGATATPANTNTSSAGFVFLNSALTKEDGTFTAFLARSASPVPAATGTPFVYTGYDIVSFIGCTMDAHIPPVGWNVTGSGGGQIGANVYPNPVTGWREYRSLTPAGQLLDVSQRLPDPAVPDAGAPGAGSLQLSADSVATFFPDRDTILHGTAPDGGTYATTGLPAFSPAP